MLGAGGITFAALGSLEVRQADRLIRLSGKQRAVLGMLLLDANMIVSRDWFTDALWDVPPRSAVANVHTYVSGLRGALTNASPDQALRLETRGSGYSLTVDRDQLDLLIFADTAERGRQFAAHGDLTAAERELASTVALWRGRPLSDVSLSDLVAPRLTEIEERFEQVWSDWIDVRLSQGDHERLVGELRRAAETQPLREPIWERLIVALHRARRRGEALDTYQRARTTLIEELGIEPGPELQRLHAAILNEDPPIAWPLMERGNPARLRLKGPGDTPAPASGAREGGPPSPTVPPNERRDPGGQSESATGRNWVKPAEVPHDVRGFAGRGRELAVLSTSLAAEQEGLVPAHPNVWVISGTAGVGKTALAVHWTHTVANAFPDGQLYVDLRGFNPKQDPVEPAAALAQMLLSLGVDLTRIPEGLDEREKLYRSVIRGRRILLLLDDARTAEQVRPLLPGHGGALVLITSRFRLSDLVVRNDAGSLPLAALSHEDARELLSHALGAESLAAELGAADDLARLCGYLPLALRIAAANIAGHPAMTIADMVVALSQGNRLSQLAVDGDHEGAVGAAFRLSYQSLPPEQQRMFRLLSLLPGPTFTPRVVTAMLDRDITVATKDLTALTAAHLIEHHDAHHYRFHGLVRLYAADRAENEETSQERQRAQYAAFAYYLHGANAAGATISTSTFPLPPELSARAALAAAELSDTAAALEWLQAELDNLISTVAYCITNGSPPFAWRIMDALRPFLRVGIYREEWLELGRRGLDAANRAEDRLAQATMHMSLGVAQLVLGKPDLAVHDLEQALDASSECGWQDGVAEASTHLSGARQQLGDFGEAVNLARRALELHKELDRPNAQAAANAVLGSAHWWYGDLAQALQHQERAYALYQKTGSVFGQAICLTELAATLHELGDVTGAARRYTQALSICEHIGATGRQVQTLAGLSRVNGETGNHEQALRNAELAVTLSSSARDRRAQAIALDALARACLAAGRHDDGYEHQRKALDVAEQVGVAWDIAYVLIGLTERHHADPNQEELRSFGHRALAIAREHRFRLLEGKAAKALATISVPDEAPFYYRIALRAYQQTNHRPGIDRIRRLLEPPAPVTDP